MRYDARAAFFWTPQAAQIHHGFQKTSEKIFASLDKEEIAGA